jgi:protein involved in polysaccharide export with SLBB domain
MGRLLPVFLMRLATLVVASLLLFAVFGHARAQSGDDNYGLKRFSGDNYDTLSAPARRPSVPPPSPAPQPQPSHVPATDGAAAGYYPTLNGNQANAAQPAYQPPASTMPYGYRPAGPAQSAQPTYPAPRSDRYAYQPGGFEYVLGPGDKLRLTVFGESDLSGEFVIDGAGFVRLPLVGEVRAAGYTSQQLEGAIGAALSPAYLKSPRIAVEVSTYRPFYIIGAVNRPGQYPYIDHMTALNAVALAGGFLPSAVESVVFIRREGSNEEIEVPADRTTDIHPGDVVKVHTTFFADAVSFLSPFSGAAASAATAAVIQ